jgi:hypothetical protein
MRLQFPAGHDMALDVKRLQLFCCACQDYVYDRDFDCAKLVSAPSSIPSMSCWYALLLPQSSIMPLYSMVYVQGAAAVAHPPANGKAGATKAPAESSGMKRKRQDGALSDQAMPQHLCCARCSRYCSTEQITRVLWLCR